MTTATRTYDRTSGAGRVTFPRVLRSEWIKLRSLRSTVWSFAIVIAVSAGLAPEGVLGVRQFARQLAGEGRTVFLSSHLMSEMAQTADHIIVLGRGRIIADAPVQDILTGATRNAVRVRTPQPDLLANLVAGPDVTVTGIEAQLLEVGGLTSAQVGEAAAQAGIVLHELTPINASLEEAYLALTQDDVEYRTEISR